MARPEGASGDGATTAGTTASTASALRATGHYGARTVNLRAMRLYRRFRGKPYLYTAAFARKVVGWEMTDTELRKLAEDATPGPWTATCGGVDFRGFPTNWTVHYSTGGGNYGFNEANAAYIAAVNPQAVLALLDRIAELERRPYWRQLDESEVDAW